MVYFQPGKLAKIAGFFLPFIIGLNPIFNEVADRNSLGKGNHIFSKLTGKIEPSLASN